MKMKDVFRKRVDFYDVFGFGASESEAAAHAINCHDELVRVIEAIEDRLPRIADPEAVAETDLEVCLDWRIWSDIKRVLAKAKGGAS